MQQVCEILQHTHVLFRGLLAMLIIAEKMSIHHLEKESVQPLIFSCSCQVRTLCFPYQIRVACN